MPACSESAAQQQAYAGARRPITCGQIVRFQVEAICTAGPPGPSPLHSAPGETRQPGAQPASQPDARLPACNWNAATRSRDGGREEWEAGCNCVNIAAWLLNHEESTLRCAIHQSNNASAGSQERDAGRLARHRSTIGPFFVTKRRAYCSGNTGTLAHSLLVPAHDSAYDTRHPMSNLGYITTCIENPNGVFNWRRGAAAE
ncbi:hypothetical protein CC78DRAFT_582032 [Lojkania enalia]|uniref:Uncharacterized protein n=1 Tax=Lojkania enalia TaxID=147567 RepID=A0A9P4K5H9_9PLEO|nr:hypothetical protein CC78DRAFT_582032 [Didymosphaeria enalia]